MDPTRPPIVGFVGAGPGRLNDIRRTNALVAHLSDEDRSLLMTLPDRWSPLVGRKTAHGIMRTNGFEPEGAEGQFTLCVFRAHLRHSCAPNIDYSVDEGGVQRFWARRDIACGEELVVSYAAFCRPHLERQSLLKQLRGIDCSCEVCSMSHEELKVSDARRADREKLEATMLELFQSQPQRAYEAFERAFANAILEGDMDAVRQYFDLGLLFALRARDDAKARAYAMHNYMSSIVVSGASSKFAK